MILDNESHRAMMLELIKQSQFMGESIDEIYELKQAIIKAKLKDDNKQP